MGTAPSSTAAETGEAAFVSEVRKRMPKLKWKKAEIKKAGSDACFWYGFDDEMTREEIRSARADAIDEIEIWYDLSKKQARRFVGIAESRLCPVTEVEKGETQESQTPAVPEKQYLTLPDNSGWALDVSAATGLKSLKADISPGLVLPLGNAAELGITLWGFGCSENWYTSGGFEVQFLDENGNPVTNNRLDADGNPDFSRPPIFSRNYAMFGYSTSDFDSAGCGSDTVDLSEWARAKAIRIGVIGTNGGRGSLSLFANSFLP